MSDSRTAGITGTGREPAHPSSGIASPPLRLVRMLLLVTLSMSTPFGIFANENTTRSAALKIFESFEAEIASAISDGRLPAEVAERAEELRLDLERDLIRIEAEIAVLRLDARRFTGTRQEEAIDQLIREVVRREKRIYDQIQRLEQLVGMPVCLPSEEEGEESENPTPRLEFRWEPEEFVDDVPS